MNIQTKFDIDDEIRYQRIIEYGNKKRKREIHVGIVESIHYHSTTSTHVSKGKISYGLYHHGGTVNEEDVVCKLTEA